MAHGKTKIRTRRMMVSPRVAGRWIEHTDDAVKAGKFKQRPVSDAVVKTYVREITEGRWKENGVTIKLTSEGYVLDGRHRLWAVVEADKPIASLVAFNVPVETFDTIDRGHGRTVGHILTVAGESSGNTLASALSWLYRYRNERMLVTGSHGRPTATEAQLLLDDEPEIRESLTATDGVRRDKVLPHAPAAFCHYIFVHENKSGADEFFTGLASGADLGAGSPVLALRRKLLARHGSKYKMATVEMIALTFKAWRLYLQGKEARGTRSLVWRTTGEKAEDFPYLDGRKKKRRARRTKKK